MDRAFRLRPLFPVWMLLSLLASGPLRAAEGRWEPVGPSGADISALAVAPSASRILYAGTRAGKVYRSADAGVTWRDVSGDFPPGPHVEDLEVDPRNPARAWAVVCDPEYYHKPAVGGLFRTVDAGRTWELVEGLDECQVLDLAIDPRNPARMLAATVHGLYQSTDGGTTWRAQGGRFRLGHVMVLEFDPKTPGVVYGIDYYEGFVRSTNGGATWTVRNAGLPDPRPQLNGLAVSTGGPKTLILHAYDHNTPLFRSLDGGLTWSPAANGLGRRPVNDVAAGAAPPRFYAATDDGIWVSANRGASWQAPDEPEGRALGRGL
ncbi:MAG TPA: hypothetical protein VHN15_08155, partial [Thermoanaerobaculia bacterium]|nr:hypothetical protein [Thermoanaerobaculia bacterium]